MQKVQIKNKNTYILLGLIIFLILNLLFLLNLSSFSSFLPKDLFTQTEKSSHSTHNLPSDEELEKIMNEKDPQTAWNYILSKYRQNPQSQLEAHDVAHHMGGVIFAKKGLSGMTICTADFAFGCYHGLLDSAFQKDLSSLSQAEKACQKVGPVDSGPYSSCVHGIGHGVASYFKTKDLHNALKTCDSLPGKAPQFCHDGVFMEFARSAPDDFYRENDPLYPCDTLENSYVYSCGRNQPSVLMQKMHKSFRETAEICKTAKESDLRSACYTALGFQTVYQSKNNPQKIIELCQTLNDNEFKFRCKQAAAGELIFQNLTDWKTNSALICQSLSEKDRDNCLNYTLGIQQNYRD